MSDVYSNPKYYEIAFDFRDIPAEVDVLEQVIELYSHIRVSTVLDLGCGPAPHLAELACRGYQYTGLDLSPAMLDYAQSKGDAANAAARFKLDDMADFRLDEQVDFAMVLLGSLEARSTAELVSHFDSVSRALKPGGLYLLDWCVEFAPGKNSTDSWETVRGQVTVKTTHQVNLIYPVEQIVEWSLVLEVEDGGAKKVFQEVFLSRQVYPQEFLLFIAARSDFEFVGWWNNWDLTQPLGGTYEVGRPIIVLRRV